MDIGNLVARITADVSNFKAGINTAQKTVSGLGASVKSATTTVSGGLQDMAGKAVQLAGAAKTAGSGVAGLLSSIASIAGPVGIAIAVIGVLVIAFKALFNVIRETHSAFMEYQAAMLGLSSVAAAFGESQEDARQAANDLAEDGLIPVTTAAAGLRAIMSTGLSLPKAIELMRAYKDEAAFGRSSTISYDQAVLNLAESFKTESSMIGNMSGQTENYNMIIDIGASMLGKKTSQLSNAERQEAKYLGTLEVARKAHGDVNRYLETTAGKLSQLRKWWIDLKVAIGDMFDPVVRQAVDILLQLGKAIGFVVIPMVKSFATGLYTLLWAINLVIKGVGFLLSLLGAAAKSIATFSITPLKDAWKKGLDGMKVHFTNYAKDIKQIQTGSTYDVSKEQAKMFDDTVEKAKEARAKMQEQIDEENEAYERAIESRTKAFQESLEDMIWAHLEKRDSILKQLQEENESYEERMKERKESLDESVEEMIERHEEKVADIKAQIAEENADYEEKMTSRTEDYEIDMMEMAWAHEDKVEAIKKQMDDEKKKFEENQADKIRDIMYEIGHELAKRDEANQYRLEQLNKLLAEEKAKVFDANSEAMVELQKRLDKENEEYEYDKAKKEKRFAEETETLKKAHEKRIKDLEERLARENADHEKALAKKYADYEKETAKLKTEHDKRVAEYQESLRKEEEILNKHAADVAAVKDKAKEDDITRLKRKHAEELAEMEYQHNKKIEKIKKQAAEQGVTFDESLAGGIDAGAGMVVGAGEDLAEDLKDELDEGGEKAGKSFWQRIWDGMKSVYGSVKNWIVDAVNWLKDNPVRWLGEKLDEVRRKGEEMVASAKSYWERAMAWVRSSFSFQSGGVVPGPTNRAVPAILHGGETVIPAGKSLAASGNNVYVDMKGANISSPEVAEEYAQIIGDKIVKRLSKARRGYV